VVAVGGDTNDVCFLLFNWQGDGSDVHHNEIYDKGAETTSRRQQIAGVHFGRGGSKSKAHHNIILRGRQTGVAYNASEASARLNKPEAEGFAVYNNAAVTITDATGKEVFTGRADNDGLVKSQLMEYLRKPDGKTVLTPHTVKVTDGAKAAAKQVAMDKPQQVAISLE
jgi:hypothetical protein